MSFSATRLTCFALISALEDDLRAEIDDNIGPADATDVLSEDHLAKVAARRTKDHPGHPTAVLSALLSYLDFSDAFEILLSKKAVLPDLLRQTLKTQARLLPRLTEIRNRVAHTRPMEIDDLPYVLDFTKDLVQSPGPGWPTLRETFDRLDREPAYVLSLSINLPTDPDRAPQHNLPIPDFDETGFFGRRSELLRIKRAIKGPYPVVSVLGDGGIGKTSIALKAAYDLLDDSDQLFDAIVWVTAKATILTQTEILHISDAIEDSLGLFSAAATELAGAQSATQDPVAEVLLYLGNFRILLILDNLETVLDQRLRNFLLELPTGSKVIITSRIGLGIENPVNLDPMSDDDSERLLRALARIRNVPVLSSLQPAPMSRLLENLKGHPAYIKWLVAGVQAGRRPSELITDNKLVLDFCMSNVYDRLTDNATPALRSMQVLAGPRSQAELAYVNEYSATQIQAALLELMTTNFVVMKNHGHSESLDTTYQISEFAKQYLDTRHAVRPDERAWLLGRHQQLYDMGVSLRAAGTANPYSPDTVDIRGTDDYHVARLLRDAIIQASGGDTDGSLHNCREAQLLAPTYHEAWRVEAYIQSLRADYNSALTAYERARELASESPSVNFLFGTFLVHHNVDPRRGLELLQAAARLERDEPLITAQISWAHLVLGDYDSCLESVRHFLLVSGYDHPDGNAVVVAGLRASVYADRHLHSGDNLDSALGYIELAVELVETAQVEYLGAEAADRVLQLKEASRELGVELDDDFLVKKAREFEGRFGNRMRAVDTRLLERRMGNLKALLRDKYYGFIRCASEDYFFHYSTLSSQDDWESLSEGDLLAFTPSLHHLKGKRAVDVRRLG
jgi:LuxR family glucitol operon transcriptional activator